MIEISPPRTLHIITSLDTGGAEMMLAKLLEAQRGQAESRVIVLMRGGSLLPRIRAAGITVESLGLSQGSIPGPNALWNLYRFAREFAPTVLQGWMYHGNLAACLLHALLRRDRPRLYWNVRQTLYAFEREKLLTRWVIDVTRRLADSPDRIVYNSVVSATQHEAIGYPAKRRIVIPNGFDTELFFSDPEARTRVRRELALSDDTPVVGQVARFHPMKDHATLLQAAKRVVDSGSRAMFLLVGRGLTAENTVLCRGIDELGLRGRVILAGERSDIPGILAALDILVSASAWGEGFPNVIGEAMACKVPCVVTDVGDSAAVVGNCGTVVPAGNPDSLASAIQNLLDLGAGRRAEIGAAARDRVIECFSLERISDQYLALYEERQAR